jgi:hypothetical protein
MQRKVKSEDRTFAERQEAHETETEDVSSHSTVRMGGRIDEDA